MGLIARPEFQEQSLVVLLPAQGEPILQAEAALGPACWCQLLGATAATAGSGESSFQAAGVLWPDCPCRQGAQYSGTAAGSGKPSLWVAGVLGAACQHSLLGPQYTGTAASLGEPSLLAWPSVNRGAAGAMGPAYTETLVSLAFQGEGSRLCSNRERGAPSSCVCGEEDLTA
jgi:hypothetical protein